MADGAFGSREIVIDLTQVGARVLRAFPSATIIHAVKINGTAGAGAGDIILRKTSATGPIVFEEPVASGTPVDGALIPMCTYAKGLFMDALPAPWTAGSILIIYTE